MKWPLESQAVPHTDTPFFNQHYLYARGAGTPDSTIVWTSEVPWQPMQDYAQLYKRKHSRFISTSHILTQSIGQSLAEHPLLNRRVVGRRVHGYKDCNVCLATRIRGCDEVFMIQVHGVDQLALFQIAYIVMMKQMEYARSDSRERRDLKRYRKLPRLLGQMALRFGDWLDRNFVVPVFGRLDRFRESSVLVNDFSSSQFPVMRGYKPSRQPGESKPLSITLGPPEEKVVWKNGAAEVEKVAPLCVRVDHRVCDSYQLAQFVNTVIQKLSDPAAMEPTLVYQQTNTAPGPPQMVSPKKIAA